MSARAVHYDVGIIGAGFGGLLAALELKRRGRQSFVVFERADGVGGVWRDNIYPGCACDIRSHLYCLAARPNPDWSSNYAAQPEILAYLQGVARRDELDAHIRFRTEICEVKFLEAEGCWALRTLFGEVTLVRVVIMATGPHSRPRVPEILGRDIFHGASWHSTKWDAGLDLRGLRIAVVGSAASAVQIVPSIASQAAQVAVFQRSPNWIIKRGERPLSTLTRWLFRRAPQSQALLRKLIYWAMEAAGLAVLGYRPAAYFLTCLARRNLRAVVDPVTRRRLTPDYPIGCKRILVSDSYYPTFNRPNVELVTEGIVEITSTGVQTNDGKHRAFDVIVWATGFHVADPDGLVRVVGRGGRALAEEWAERGMQGFLGVHASGYPNLAFLLGPNSGPANSTAIHIMESQMGYICRFIEAVAQEERDTALDVKPELQDAYNAAIQERLNPTAWNAGCGSWYIDRRGRNTTMYPGVTSTYRRLISRFDRGVYVEVRLSPQQRRDGEETSKKTDYDSYPRKPRRLKMRRR